MGAYSTTVVIQAEETAYGDVLLWTPFAKAYFSTTDLCLPGKCFVRSSVVVSLRKITQHTFQLEPQKSANSISHIPNIYPP